MTRISRDAASLQELLNYRLGRLLGVAGLPIVRACEAMHGISRREWGLLAVLGHAGELSPSRLASEMTLDRARTSRVLQQLIRKGLVERRQLPGDRRQARVCLTPSGEGLYQALLPLVADQNRQLLAVLGDAELQALDDYLQRLQHRAHLLCEEGEGLRARRYLGGHAAKP
ncbi:MarR family transcriptional regulator [Ramlibacter sp. AW1]|uniref:MarR family transcriptional regulator n=1 Tax=Ramlibacter aurantiacus TaxID=2801330 RepID=A0A936ZQ23_9BURK|nr:MarR family transcriptional regulator [Ramlibacter aurantiacus]MBL0421465.1 MarR family transcriptional regulator [Ramlibacter aurantiacus]